MTTTPLESSTSYYGYVLIEDAEIYAQEYAAAEVSADRASRAPNESMASMNLRDWFAAQTLSGLTDDRRARGAAEISKHAYQIADAMMKARAL